MVNKVGRPVKHKQNSGFVSSLLTLQCQEIDPEDEQKRSHITIVNDQLIKQAKKGIGWAIKLLYERMDGLPMATLDLAQAVGIVQQASREDKQALASTMGLYAEDFGKKLDGQGIVIDVAGVDLDGLGDAIVKIRQAIATNPGAMRKLLVPMINNFEVDTDEDLTTDVEQ